VTVGEDDAAAEVAGQVPGRLLAAAHEPARLFALARRRALAPQGAQCLPERGQGPAPRRHDATAVPVTTVAAIASSPVAATTTALGDVVSILLILVVVVVLLLVLLLLLLLLFLLLLLRVRTPRAASAPA
jgi:hypothetical protein